MTTSISNHIRYNSSTDGKYYLILFLIWPFLALIMAIGNYNRKEAKKVVFIFLVYFGLSFVADNWQLDSYRYVQALQRVSLLPFSEFFRILGGLYSGESAIDIYEPFVTFFISRFTTNHRVLFAVYAAVFGFFYLKSINILYVFYRENPRLNALIHLVFFIVILPITAINGVRMWTAAWIFFYGAINVVLFRDKRFLFIALASLLVHWSFLTANVILIVYLFLGNRNILYLPLAIASFFIPQLLLPLFSSISLRLGGSFQNRYEGYTSEGYILDVQQVHEEASWFVFLGNELIYYYLIFALIIIYIGFRKYMKSRADKNLFSFLLLFLSFVNFGINVPSFGNRFQIVFFLFATFYICMFFIKLPEKKVSLITWIGFFPMVLYSAVTFRIYSETISAWLFMPGFGSPLLTSGLSVAELLFY